MSIDGTAPPAPKRAWSSSPTMLVLVVEPVVDALHAAQPFEVDEREPAGRQRAEVAAGPLDGEHVARLAGDRILELDLRGRVAAAEVRDAWVGAEAA